MKNTVANLRTLLLTFCCLLALSAPAAAAAVLMPPPLVAQAAVLLEAGPRTLLYDKEGEKRMYPASTTKIMTFLLAQKKGALDSVVTVSARAAACEGSSLETSTGDHIRLRDLLYGLMMVSGNDAAEAVAEHISGSIPAFVRLMNEEAGAIGASHTHFANPHGLPNSGHYTTAYDLALITDQALRNPEFSKVTTTKDATIRFLDGEPRRLKNTNKLLGVYPGITGGKTGYTEAAGDCLVVSAKRGNVQLIAVILNSDERWDDAKNLLDFGFKLKGVN